MTGALAGLHVFEREIVNRSVIAMRMAYVVEHQARGRPDVELVRGASDAAHEAARLL